MSEKLTNPTKGGGGKGSPLARTKTSVSPEGREELLRKVCAAYNNCERPFYDATPSDVVGRRRFKEASQARHLFRWAFRCTFNIKLVDMGELLSCDHATIIHSTKVAEQMIHQNPELAEELSHINPKLEERCLFVRSMPLSKLPNTYNQTRALNGKQHEPTERDRQRWKDYRKRTPDVDERRKYKSKVETIAKNASKENELLKRENEDLREQLRLYTSEGFTLGTSKKNRV